MDLILWRHAQAEDAAPGQDDLLRALTGKGEKQAARVGAWLDRQLPEGARVLCSPALRCQQTAQALGRKVRIEQSLAPDAIDAAGILQLAQWPDARHPVLVVGHQPVLGDVVARLLGVGEGECPVGKGTAWWLRARERDGRVQAVVVAVLSPDVA